MSLLEELESCINSDAPSYMEFLYRYNPKKKQIFAFYEGDEDSSFYSYAIKKYTDKEYELEEIVAGCKNNVLKLWREFNWETYNQNQIAFFVDRDLSYWLGEPTEYGKNVFVTDGYSIENYVTNTQGFKAWLLHFQGFSRARKQEVDFMISEFETRIAEFQEQMIPVMAQAVVAKRHDRSVSLGEFKITGNGRVQFEMNNGHVYSEIHFDSGISKKWGLTDEDNEEIMRQTNQFKEDADHYSVRGKWELSFLAELGEYMRINANLFAPSVSNNGKVSPTCAVPLSRCLTVLAPYCAENVPPRLESFLKSTYVSYIANA